MTELFKNIVWQSYPDRKMVIIPEGAEVIKNPLGYIQLFEADGTEHRFDESTFMISQHTIDNAKNWNLTTPPPSKETK